MHSNALPEVSKTALFADRGLKGWLLRASRMLFANARRQDARQMRVVEALTLGPKKQLLLVSCDGQRFLIGTGADSVQTIVAIHPETPSLGVGN